MIARYLEKARMTADARHDLLNEAFELYAARPSQENGIKLRAELGHYLAGHNIAAIGPTLAAIEILRERKHDSDTWRVRIASQLIIRALRFQLKPDRVGWNDYWMTRWLFTKDENAMREIHRRAWHIKPGMASRPYEYLSNPANVLEFANDPWAMVAFTAAWMSVSQGAANPEFAVAMHRVLRSCESCRMAAVEP